MILIDALYVNMGGAFQLLKYLIDTLEKRSISFFLLADARCAGKLDDVSQVCYLDATLKNRRLFYKRGTAKDISSVFCFGNVPPPVKLNVPVYTYFHNINLLTLRDCQSKTQLFKYLLKRLYIRLKRYNTNEWLVQTSNTANELVKHLGVVKEIVSLYPFYKLPSRPLMVQERTDYIFVGEYTGSKGHDELVEAWRILHRKGFDRTLHLTVSPDCEFGPVMNQAVKEGVAINNHGFLSQEDLANIYAKCKATVYPSKNESFGLGLMEAMALGCDVIGADLPYVYSVCEPSAVFNPRLPDSIANTVYRYDNRPHQKTRQIIANMINDLIDHIVKQ